MSRATPSVPLRDEIRAVLNQYSAENGSNTPDFILAEYLLDCLDAFDRAVTARSRWYGDEKWSRPYGDEK